jgi:DNA-binding NarL/FixJ family response regulator
MLAAEHQTPAALVLIADLERQPKVLGRQLVDLFGLTPAEACLVVALVAGKRLEDIAEERGVRMPTLRTQLHAILDKTGTRRQADLMRLIVDLPAVRMRWEIGRARYPGPNAALASSGTRYPRPNAAAAS